MNIPLEFSQQLSPVDGKPFDLGIYKLLEPMSTGYRPAIKRRYQFVGRSRGEQCNFPVEIEARHDVPGYFRVQAVFAMNCWFVPDYVHERDLRPLPP